MAPIPRSVRLDYRSPDLTGVILDVANNACVEAWEPSADCVSDQYNALSKEIIGATAGASQPFVDPVSPEDDPSAFKKEFCAEFKRLRADFNRAQQTVGESRKSISMHSLSEGDSRAVCHAMSDLLSTWHAATSSLAIFAWCNFGNDNDAVRSEAHTIMRDIDNVRGITWFPEHQSIECRRLNA